MMTARNIQSCLRGRLLHKHSLAALTSWKVGGPADQFYRPADLEDLCHFLAGVDESLPVICLGLGSNVLIRDGGIRGVVIGTHQALNHYQIMGPSTLRMEAGVPCAKVARIASGLGLGGAEFLAGIPGTLGGALAMNAGAYGGETWSLVEAVETVDRRGGLHTRPGSEYQIGYRSVAGPENEWFVAALLNLVEANRRTSLDKITKLLAQRAATQPLGVASCGSVFRNPDNDYAARLIDASGLKGFCLGGACVSEQHANFIINTGKATAADIESLIQHIQRVVQQTQNITLQTEVRIIGDPAS